MPTKTEEKPKDAKKEGGEAPPPRKKLGILIGAATFVVLGVVAAFVAAPKKEAPKPRLEGPHVAKLSREDLQVNLAGENGKRYLVLSLSAEYFAYDPAAVLSHLGVEAEAEAGDTVFATRLKDTMLRLAARKTREQVEDPVQMEAFLVEVRSAIEPLVFPVTVGDATSLQSSDSASGLRVGESVMDSTLRGLLHDHELEFDSKRKTVTLDEGPEVAYRGDERDLRVASASGETVFLDVSGLDAGFSGKVPVGVTGRLRRIYREQVLVQ